MVRMATKFMKVENGWDEYTQHLISVSERYETVLRDKFTKIARKYLSDLKKNTPVKTGKLKKQWDEDNVKINVIPTAKGYYIELVNTTEYASWVEKGHESYNQYGGSYGWVMGRFYVRKTENLWKNGKLDTELKNQFEKWLKNNLEVR